MTATRAELSASKPGPRLVRRNYGRGHGYKLDGHKIPGVTTVLNALPKELKQWAANCAAEYAIDHWDELAETSVAKRLDKIRYAYKDVVVAAALRGTQIHELGEKLVHGQPVDVPEEHRGPVEAYARFLDHWQIEPVAVETPLASTQYGGYGGTADLWGTIGARGGARALIDIKTGKGVYESTVLQLAAYRYAEMWQPDGPESEQSPIPEVDMVYVAHVLPDDVRFLPVKAGPNEYRQFLYTKVTWAWLDAHGFRGPEPLIGEAERLEAPA